MDWTLRRHDGMMTALEPWLVNVHEIVCGLDLVGNLVLTLELLWGLP